MKVDLSCPIELWAYELPTAENPTISFTFFNLGERTIASIQVTVTSFDEQDTVLSRRVERPMALDAAGREPFLVTLAGDDVDIDALDLAIDKVWFEDGEEWRRQQDVRLAEYEPNELPPNRKLEQLRFVAGEDAVGFPSDQGNVWICICGRVNAKEERKCRRCARDKERIFTRYAPDAVQAVIDARERQLEEKARMAREEASRQEFMRQDRARRKRRARRTRTAVITIGLVVVVLVYLFVVLGLPEMRYQSALSALAKNDIATARAAFVELADYREAPDLVQECDLRLGLEYASSGDMDKVDTSIALLTALGTYPGAREALQDATYQKALLYMEDKAYAEASALLLTIPDHPDAEDVRDQAEYQIAKQEMNAGAYTEAAARFQVLGNYLDSAALAKECIYRPAVSLMNSGSFYEAAEMFATIMDYSDASEQRLEALRLDAIQAQNAGEYQYAAERFAMLGSYKDAPEQYKRTVYLNANAYRDSGKYDLAIKLYATIPEYEDAAEQVRACTYLPAKALMTDGQYEEAAAMFKSIPGYLDADELYNQCIYLPAVQASRDGDYDTAIELFSIIPEYSDVSRLLPQAEYRRAEKLETEGDLEGAIAAFGALADYSDAMNREKAARYAWAEAAFDVGQYALAAERFEELGRYSDAQTRVKECAYELAMLLFNAGNYQDAYEALVAIDAYEPARSKAREAAYAWAVQLTDAGDLQGASDAFGLAGRYEDAADRQKESLYQIAQGLMDQGAYQEAGAMFDSISGYTDARAKRDESYDLWLSGINEQAEASYNSGAYQEVINLLAEMDFTTLPRAYANIKTMYQDANLKLARQLINEDRALEAYGYLVAADGYRNAGDLLDKNIYRILGTWETEEGIRYAFYLNGTANIAGEQGYFNMFNPYGISFGTTADKESMVRILSYSSGNAESMRLREDATGTTLVMTRVKPPEVSETNDSDGMQVLPEMDLENMEDAVIDVMQVGGETPPEEQEAPQDEPPEDEDADATQEGDEGDAEG